MKEGDKITRSNSRHASNEFWGVKKPVRSNYLLQLSNVHYSVTKEDLQSIFKDGESLLDVVIKYDVAGRSLGEAVLSFATEDSQNRAYRRNIDLEIDGFPVDMEKTILARPLNAAAISRYGDFYIVGIYLLNFQPE
jgi:RNA recognition motif-containing protein